MLPHKLLALSAIASIALAGTSVTYADDVTFTPDVQISNMYLYRGENLGGNTPYVLAGAKADYKGWYGGVNAMSTADGEYDTYAGYTCKVNDKFSADLSLWAYTIPDSANTTWHHFGHYSEAFLTLTYDIFSLSYASNTAGDPGLRYYNAGVALGKFGVAVGKVDALDSDNTGFTNESELVNVVNDYVHVDVSYAFNDNLKFVASQIVQQDSFTFLGSKRDDRRDTNLHLAATYTVPFN